MSVETLSEECQVLQVELVHKVFRFISLGNHLEILANSAGMSPEELLGILGAYSFAANGEHANAPEITEIVTIGARLFEIAEKQGNSPNELLKIIAGNSSEYTELDSGEENYIAEGISAMEGGRHAAIVPEKLVEAAAPIVLPEKGLTEEEIRKQVSRAVFQVYSRFGGIGGELRFDGSKGAVAFSEENQLARAFVTGNTRPLEPIDVLRLDWLRDVRETSVVGRSNSSLGWVLQGLDGERAQIIAGGYFRDPASKSEKRSLSPFVFYFTFPRRSDAEVMQQGLEEDLVGTMKQYFTACFGDYLKPPNALTVFQKLRFPFAPGEEVEVIEIGNATDL